MCTFLTKLFSLKLRLTHNVIWIRTVHGSSWVGLRNFFRLTQKFGLVGLVPNPRLFHNPILKKKKKIISPQCILLNLTTCFVHAHFTTPEFAHFPIKRLRKRSCQSSLAVIIREFRDILF